MAAGDSPHPRGSAAGESGGYCPVCGAEVLWVPTAHLWPSRRQAKSALPSLSGACPGCGRTLMYTVVHDPDADAGGPTKWTGRDDCRSPEPQDRVS